MKYILTKVPVIEDLLVKDLREYLGLIRFKEQYPNHKNLGVSNDHPFERLLASGEPDFTILPSITIVSANDGEVQGMSKGWKITSLEKADIIGMKPEEWILSETALVELNTAFQTKDQIHGLMHSTMWRDSVSFEIWTENIQVKNDIFSLVLAYLSGPQIIGLHQKHDIVIHSNTIRGQRSGYYNIDFGKTLYGGRIEVSVDYPIMQAVYDTDISSLAEIQHSYQEVING
jgi:hypothetical protein